VKKHRGRKTRSNKMNTELTYANVYAFCADNGHELTSDEFENIVKHFEGYEDYQIENDFEGYIKFECGIE
jgi:hypothetical protein